MNYVNTSKILLCFGITGVALILVFLTVKIAEAQTSAPFLTSPYYGTTTISQFYSANHRAYDLLLRYAPVLATESGTIKRVEWFSNDPLCHQHITNTVCGFGLHIRMQHPNGYWSIYGHLSTTGFDLTTNGNAIVSQKQFIGNSGHTGYSTGPHLHFEVRPSQSGNGVDPFSPNLWEDGQWATPSRPIPVPTNLGETVVYEDTGGFTKGNGGPFNNPCSPGSCFQWIGTTGNPPYAAYYTPIYGNSSTPDEWARWQTQGVPTSGDFYNVQIHMPTTTISKTWQARYLLRDNLNNILATGVVDQAGLPNSAFTQSQWVSIGIYFLKNGYSIYTHDVTGEGIDGHCPVYCFLIVDAVKLIKRPAPFQNYLPLIIKD